MLMACAASYAQGIYDDFSGKVNNNFEEIAASMQTATLAGENTKANTLRSKATGVYYARPEGTLYRSTSPTGGLYYMTMLYTPPCQQILFKNMSTDKSSTTWTVNGTDASKYVNSDGDYVYTMPGFSSYYFYVPVIASGSTTYSLSDANENYSKYATGMRVTDGDYMSYYDFNTATNYGYGALTNVGLLGTGSYTTKSGTTYTSYGTQEIFPAPASPLYVDTIRMATIDESTTPIPAGTTISLYVYDVKTTAAGQEELGDLIATLTATSSDVKNTYTATTTRVKKYYNYIYFTQKTTDAFGGETVSPITLSNKFALVFMDAAKEGVNINIKAATECASDSVCSGAQMILNDGSQTRVGSLYAGTMTQAYGFHGVFDYIDGFETATSSSGTIENFNTLIVPTTGTTTGSDVTNMGMSSINYTQLYTAFDYTDGEGNDNYYVVDLPEWLQIKVEKITPSENTPYYHYAKVTVTSAEALPSGTKGRYAKLYFEGKGYTSKTPIIIKQGEVEVDGIESVAINNQNASVMSNKFYNLSGQEVSKEYKGIVINNGKKFMR